MKKVIGTIFVLIGTFALLAWYFYVPDQQVDAPPLVFRQVTEHPLAEVEHCILDGNGTSAFSDFEPFSISGYRAKTGMMNNLLVDSSGSRLFIGISGLDTVVTLRSHRIPSEKQMYLLTWCSSMPTEIWIPKHIRNQQ